MTKGASVPFLHRSVLSIYYKFLTNTKYHCSRQYCHCYEQVLESFFITLQDRKPFVSAMKPILRSQKQCQNVRTHFFPPSSS